MKPHGERKFRTGRHGVGRQWQSSRACIIIECPAELTRCARSAAYAVYVVALGAGVECLAPAALVELPVGEQVVLAGYPAFHEVDGLVQGCGLLAPAGCGSCGDRKRGLPGPGIVGEREAVVAVGHLGEVGYADSRYGQVGLLEAVDRLHGAGFVEGYVVIVLELGGLLRSDENGGQVQWRCQLVGVVGGQFRGKPPLVGEVTLELDAILVREGVLKGEDFRNV